MGFIESITLFGWIGLGAIAVTVVAGVILLGYFRKREREIESFQGFVSQDEDKNGPKE